MPSSQGCLEKVSQFTARNDSVEKPYTTYLCPILQQQLHAVRISNHTRTVQGLQSAVHPIHISSLGRNNDFNILDDTKQEY